jgi:hypothetical protein
MNVKQTPPTIEINLAPGGGPFKGTTEISTLGGEAVQRNNPMLGTFTERMKETKFVDIEDEWLKEGWAEESVIEIWEVNEKGGWENHGVSDATSGLLHFANIDLGLAVLWVYENPREETLL